MSRASRTQQAALTPRFFSKSSAVSSRFFSLITFYCHVLSPLSFPVLFTGLIQQSCSGRGRGGEWRGTRRAELLHSDVIASDSSVCRAARHTGRHGGRVSPRHKTQIKPSLPLLSHEHHLFSPNSSSPNLPLRSLISF